jgi:hypothetical protein
VVTHPGPSPDPDERISRIRLFRRGGSWGLVPLLSPVLVTCRSTSRRWTWVPPEDHLDTGRLCSAGSRAAPVPQRPHSYAALRLPASFGHGSGSPCRWPPSLRALLLCLRWPTTRAPATCRASETGHRLSAGPGCVEERRGPPRLRGRPLRTCHGRTPHRIPSPPRPAVLAGDCYCLQVKQDPGHPGSVEVSGPHAPWPTRSPAYASPTTFLGSSQGWLPARAGSPLAGRVSHPLDDERSFMKLSHLHSPSTHIAWSHSFSYPRKCSRAVSLYAIYVLCLLATSCQMMHHSEPICMCNAFCSSLKALFILCPAHRSQGFSWSRALNVVCTCFSERTCRKTGPCMRPPYSPALWCTGGKSVGARNTCW